MAGTDAPHNHPRNRQRLDQALVGRGLCASRDKAQRAIMAGRVTVNGQLTAKASVAVAAQDKIALTESERYVSRGGTKLEHALRHFRLDVTNQSVVDLGASTGGFTDCLLQHGAAKVYAVDVGRGQLAWNLRQDSRVIVMEKTNARALAPDRMPRPFALVDLAVIDCACISLRKILPAAIALVRPSGRIVALVKPQFEAGRREAAKGAGVITDRAIHARVLAELRDFVDQAGGLRWLGVTESPLLGPAGNREFFVALEKAR